VELGAADFAFVRDLDLGDTRSVQRENALDSLAVGNFTDGESGVDAAAALGDDETCEDLDALLAALNHPAMHLHGVADVE